ncbi:MAG: hypothetical protein IJY99_03255 [Alphaproteobacteria bacterium]|nr:hypothetical protein [Alphaproteobacteria bacterium]
MTEKDLIRTLREMAHFESMAKINMREQKHRAYHARHAFNATQQHIKQNIRSIRTKNK